MPSGLTSLVINVPVIVPPEVANPDEGKFVKLAPLIAGSVAGKRPSGIVPELRFEALPAVKPPEVPEALPVTFPVNAPAKAVAVQVPVTVNPPETVSAFYTLLWYNSTAPSAAKLAKVSPSALF